MFKKLRTIMQRIHYFIAATEEYGNGEIVERGIRIGTRNHKLILAVPTDSLGITIRWLVADYEEMCDHGWEIGFRFWQIAWGHGYHRHITGRWDWGNTYYDFGYSFDEMHTLNADVLYGEPIGNRWQQFRQWITRRDRNNYAPPPNDNEIPF